MQRKAGISGYSGYAEKTPASPLGAQLSVTCVLRRDCGGLRRYFSDNSTKCIFLFENKFQ